MPTLLDHAKRIQALAQIGLTYSPNPYDLERYEELKDIALDLLHMATGHPLEKLAAHYGDKKEYVTPKVDIRGVVFDGDKILLVKEAADGHWSLPGGWADVGYTPKEVVVKEIKEETGLEVTAERLLAVLDKRVHAHPPALEYTYKLFIGCAHTGGTLKKAHDTLDVGFFAAHDLPPLSLERVTPEQIQLMFTYKDNPGKPVTLD
jgi:ADP-ribose pyrophosphatase YjhB (NUDIX family)